MPLTLDTLALYKYVFDRSTESIGTVGNTCDHFSYVQGKTHQAAAIILVDIGWKFAPEWNKSKNVMENILAIYLFNYNKLNMFTILQ